MGSGAYAVTGGGESLPSGTAELNQEELSEKPSQVVTPPVAKCQTAANRTRTCANAAV